MMKSKARKAPAPGSFEEEFIRRLNKIEEDAKALGLNWSVICRAADIARAGPVRWRHNTPKSIKLIDQMAAAVEKLAKKKLAKVQ
jgi:hypothetical protein